MLMYSTHPYHVAGTATPWVMEDRFRSVGLAPSWTMRDYLSRARTAKPFDSKQTSRFAGTAYPCSTIHHFLPACPASPSRMGLFVGPGWAAPSMPHAVLAPFLYHPVWHRITEGAACDEMTVPHLKAPTSFVCSLLEGVTMERHTVT